MPEKKRRGRVAALLLALAAALATGCGPDPVVPVLPDDPLEYAPVAVPETTAHWQGEMAGEVTQDSVIQQKPSPHTSVHSAGQF